MASNLKFFRKLINIDQRLGNQESMLAPAPPLIGINR